MIESNRIELKRELTDSLEKEVVTFLNYREGGSIYIGIADDGTVVGVPDCDAAKLISR
jgi:ATP-dependent DNA helicase RecG